jgi:hypothetical protein
VLASRTVLAGAHRRGLFAVARCRTPNPFVSGTHLYQMGLPALMVGLLILALLVSLMGMILDRGDWPARLITASGIGIGIVVLVLLVQHSAATSVLIASSLHIHAGNALAIAAGVLIGCVGALCLLLRTRSSRRGTLIRT